MKYRKQVFKALTHIPKGYVSTYGDIARFCNIKSARVVGNILHTNINTQKYPCHRVVRSDGTLASGYAFGGTKEQRKKLKKEGVLFKGKRVIFSKCKYSFNTKVPL